MTAGKITEMPALEQDSFQFCFDIQGANLIPRVFLRHMLITKPNEHLGTLGTLRSNAPRIWVD